MRREPHVRFCERAVVKFRRATHLFESVKGRADALYVCVDGLVTTNRVRISTLALGARLPTMHVSREHVEAGGLMSYGPNFPDLYRRAADNVDKILRGTKPDGTCYQDLGPEYFTRRNPAQAAARSRGQIY